MTLAEFDDIAKAENFLNKYAVILKKRDPHVTLQDNRLITYVPIKRIIKITKKAG